MFLWGTRVTIPTKLRAQVLKELHYTHPGVVKMKGLARSYVWWLKLDSEIEQKEIVPFVKVIETRPQ